MDHARFDSFVTEAAISSKTYNALYSGDVNFTTGSNPSITVSVISSVPTNNNMGGAVPQDQPREEFGSSA